MPSPPKRTTSLAPTKPEQPQSVVSPPTSIPTYDHCEIHVMFCMSRSEESGEQGSKDPELRPQVLHVWYVDNRFDRLNLLQFCVLALHASMFVFIILNNLERELLVPTVVLIPIADFSCQASERRRTRTRNTTQRSQLQPQQQLKHLSQVSTLHFRSEFVWLMRVFQWIFRLWTIDLLIWKVCRCFLATGSDFFIIISSFVNIC